MPPSAPARARGGRVTRSDILHADDSNPRATLVADLADVSALQGLCTDDLHRDELDHRDQRYQMLVAGRAARQI